MLVGTPESEQSLRFMDISVLGPTGAGSKKGFLDEREKLQMDWGCIGKRVGILGAFYSNN